MHSPVDHGRKSVVAGSPTRPQTMRALNEFMLLEQIRAAGGVSRADLARITGLAKNTVSLALANLERADLVRVSGMRTGLPGPAATLYEMRPECGFVLGLDVGSQFIRGAIADITGTIRARYSTEVHASDGSGRVAELATLAERLRAEAGIAAADVVQTVIGSPGVYDPTRDTIALVGGRPGWEDPSVVTGLKRTFGPTVMIENDVDAAALAERAHGHGHGVDNFAFVSIGTGIGMGLVLGGKLHRGAHGAAGEIGFLPLDPTGLDSEDSRRRGWLESAAAASGIVEAARRAGIPDVTSARSVFDAAGAGDERARHVVETEATLVARAICAVVTVVDPDLVVLGGGIGQAGGFVDAVAEQLRRITPVLPQLRVSALGADAVVDGCLAAGNDRAWKIITAAIPA